MSQPPPLPGHLWSFRLGGRTLGFQLALESLDTIAWDEHDVVSLLSSTGDLQARQTIHGVCSVAISADGQVIFAGTRDGQVCWLRRDLSVVWAVQLSVPVRAVALDPFARAAYTVDSRSRLKVFSPTGNARRQIDWPCPANWLTPSLTEPALYAAAEIGLVGCFDLARFDWRWRDRPVISLGGLTLAGESSTLLMPCFSAGLRIYDATGKVRTLPTPTPVRLVGSDFAGKAFVISALDGTVASLTPEGKPLFRWPNVDATVAVAVAPQGDRLWLASHSGLVSSHALVATRQ